MPYAIRIKSNNYDVIKTRIEESVGRNPAGIQCYLIVSIAI